MRDRVWRKLSGAALLVLCLSLFGYGATVTVRSISRRAQARGHGARSQAVLYGRRLVTMGAYELNVSFTPDGQLRCVGVSTAPRPKAGDSPA